MLEMCSQVLWQEANKVCLGVSVCVLEVKGGIREEHKLMETDIG